MTLIDKTKNVLEKLFLLTILMTDQLHSIEVDESKKVDLKSKWRKRNQGKVRFTCELCKYQCLEKREMVNHSKSKKHQERLYSGYEDRCMVSHPEKIREYHILHYD